EQAELWAAMTEERVFGKDKEAFVEVGGGINAGAKLKAGIGGEVTGGFTSALRWDKSVFDAVHTQNSEHGVGLMGGSRVGKNRDQRKQMATEKRDLVGEHVKRMNRLQFGTSMEAEALGQKFSIGLEAKHTFGPTGGWEIAAKGAIPYDSSSASSSTMLSKIAASYVPAAIGGIKKIYDIYKAKNPDQGTQDQGGNPVSRGIGGVLDTGEDLTAGLDAGGMTGDLFKKLSEANPQNLVAGESDGVNDTARLWLGKSLKMDKLMGENGDMSKATSALGTASPFGASSSLEVALQCEIPNAPGEKPKFAFKVTKGKELRMGGELGGGVGLTAKLTRKQELGGVAYKSGEGFNAFTGGREAFVANGLGGGGGNP
ncbi:MAG: hypothetical protein HOV81_25335, partial [Kofleriaceae bacterium]|nr:hypothetical protein [Kofleriaceae bacterium]